MDGLLRRTLAQSGSGIGACPDAEVLAAYFERSLDSGEMKKYELHFSECADCRNRLSLMVRAEQEGEGFQPSVAAPGATGKRVMPWASGSRWLVPIAAMVLLAIALNWTLANWHKRQNGMTREVAMSSEPSSPPVASGAPASNPSAAIETKPFVQERQTTDESSTRAMKSKIAPPLVQPAQGVVGGQLAEAEPAKKAYDTMETNSGAGAGTGTGAGMGDRAEPSVAGNAKIATENAAENKVVAQAEPPPSPQEPATAMSAAPVQAVGGFDKRAMKNDDANSLKAPAQPAKAQAGAVVSSIEAANEPARIDSVPANASLYSRLMTIIPTPDPKILWRIAGEGSIERSEDGGTSWATLTVNQPHAILSGAAPDDKTCWLAGRGGLILLTKDAKKWRKIKPPVSDDFTAISAKSSRDATVTTSGGQAFTTSNGGKSWQPSN
jgi:hypothetical protein